MSAKVDADVGKASSLTKKKVSGLSRALETETLAHSASLPRNIGNQHFNKAPTNSNAHGVSPAVAPVLRKATTTANNNAPVPVAVSEPGDELEREADRVAEKIVTMADSRLVGADPVAPASQIWNRGQVMRQCAACTHKNKRDEDRPELEISRKAYAQVPTPSANVDLSTLASNAQPLPIQTRRYFEPRFAQDFSDVRIRADAQAGSMAKSLHAKAFTHGTNIVFGSGYFAPETATGKRLLAHELTHVVQQRQGAPKSIQRDELEERRKLSLELIPNADMDINVEGILFTTTAEASFQAGPKAPQLLRIAIKCLAGDQYSDALVHEISTIFERDKKKYQRSGHFRDQRDAFEGEKIERFFFSIDPFLVITGILAKHKIELKVNGEQLDQLRLAFAQKRLWQVIHNVAKTEGLKIPTWYVQSVFSSQMQRRMNDLVEFKNLYFQYEKDRDDVSKSEVELSSEQIFYSLYNDIALLEALRVDTDLYKNPLTQPAYKAIWFLSDKQMDAGTPATALHDLDNIFKFLDFSLRHPTLRLNSETSKTARVEILLRYILEVGISEKNIRVLPPYPAFISSTNINANNTTVATASNTFKMILNTEAVHGMNLMYGVSTAMARKIYFSWDVVPIPDSLKYMRDKTGASAEELVKEADSFVKNSPQNLKTPLLSYAKDEDYTQEVVMKKLGIGDYLLVGRAAPQYRSDMHWVQHPSSAGYPFFVYDSTTLANSSTYSDWDRLNKLKAQHQSADPKDAEALQTEIDHLEKRESSGLQELTAKDLEDTQKLIKAAGDLKKFIQDDRANNISVRGDANTDPFIVRLKNYVDPTLYHVYLLIQEMYDPRRYDDLTAIDEYLKILTAQEKELEKLGARVGDAHNRFKAGGSTYRVVAALVKSADGNAVPLMLVAGEHPDSEPGKYKIKLVDVTFDAAKKKEMIYVGKSAGTMEEAVRQAFITFGEDNKYGNGKIVYRLPQTRYGGVTESITKLVEYLEYALAALGIIMLVAGTVATAGALSPAAAMAVTALGVSLAVVGAAMAVRNMNKRDEKGTLEMDNDTAMDIISILGAVVVVVGTVTKVAAVMRTASLSRVLTIQRLERLIVIYDITELGANIYLVNAKVKEDIDAIKALGLPKHEEENMIASVTFDAIQQGAMMAVSAYGTLKQIPDTYRAHVETSRYQSWHEKGWLKINGKGEVEITDLAPPFLQKNKTAVGSVAPDAQQGDAARKATIIEPLVQKPTLDGEHKLTLTERGRIIRCSDLCQDLRAKYQKVLEQDPELHKQLLKIEEKAAQAAKTNDKALASEAIDEAIKLEGTLRWASDEWAKFTGVKAGEVEAAFDPAAFSPGTVRGGEKSGHKIDDTRIPSRQRRRVDAIDIMTEAEIASKDGLKQALTRMGKVLGKTVADIPELKPHWEAAVTTVLKGKPITDYPKETVNGQLYPQANKLFWKLVAGDPAAVALLNDSGFSIGKKGNAPLAELGPVGRDTSKGAITDQERRVSLDHKNEKAQGDNWERALDADNLELMLHNANSEKEIVQSRHKLRDSNLANPPPKTTPLVTPEEQRLMTHSKTLGMPDSEMQLFLDHYRKSRIPIEDMIRQMERWASPLKRSAKARARVAPDMVLDLNSRARLPDFEQQVAGTGGIEKITVKDAPGEGKLAVSIEGIILPGRLTREASKVSATRARAPDFNTSDKLFSVKEAGLNKNWQRLHLWGPGFGDEAAAGMMWGPRKVNLVWQNESIESYIRQLATLNQRYGGTTRLKATAIAWEDPTPGGFKAPQGENFLKRVEYVVTLQRPGQPDTSIRVTLDVAEPPKTDITSFSIDPPNAINLGDLFPTAKKK
jgi:uncharacterized membrane protein HdeD (DUF308 family)